MRLLLQDIDHSNDLFCDSLLRRLKDLPIGTPLTIDISGFSGANDFQLSSLPFVLSYLKNKRKIDITVEFPVDDFFKEKENDFLNYLYASGFFTFIESVGLKSHKYIPKKGYNSKDPLIKFQGFRNIAYISHDSKNINNESGRLLYELQSNLRAKFEESILINYYATAEKLTRIIAKELIENINLHSGASLALLRFHYLDDIREVEKRYGRLPLLEDFFQYHKNSPLFVISISDNGMGIIDTLKAKYQKGDFLVGPDERLKDILEKPNSWWLSRAFASHITSDKNVRTRLGLKTILATICDLNGFLYLRSGDATAFYNKYDGNPSLLDRSLLNPDISGTHFLLIFPAEHKKIESFSDAIIYSSTGRETWRSSSNLTYSECDISYVSNVSPISTSIEVSYKYPNKIIEIISERIEKVISDNSGILVIDFANALKEKIKDYSFILKKLVDKYGKKFGQFCVLRNVLNSVIHELRKSKFAEALAQIDSFVIIFSNVDRLSFVGIQNGEIEHDLLKIQRNSFLTTKEINTQTVKLIGENDRLVKTANLDGVGRIAYFIDFNSFFSKSLSEKIQNELESSGALINGHFHITSTLHVNRYLIGPYMFHNPALCRAYAKEIFKIIHNTKPDILLTYSTSGIIMHYYLRNYFIHDLKLMLVNSPQDLTLSYGEEITKNQKILILIDVKCTGSFLTKLNQKAATLSGHADNIIAHIAMFDINKSNTTTGFAVKAIYDGVNVEPKTPDQCDCHTKGTSYVNYRSDLSIEMASGIPTIRQKESSNLSELLIKKDILRTSNRKCHSNVEATEMRSRIDDEKLTEFDLVQYWKQLEKVFQLGHVERGDTHFEHYDISERLLFDKNTRSELEAFIKQYVWSFNEEIHYVIYNKDLTAAVLAHIVASRFLKKPEVIEAVKYSDGSFVLPRKVSQSLNDKKVLLVDDSVNTGATMIELIGLVNIYGGIISGIFTITNRTSPEIEIALRNMVPNVACAYRFNLPIYKKSKCTLCSYKKTIESYIEHAGTKEIAEYLNAKLPFIKVKPFEKT